VFHKIQSGFPCGVGITSPFDEVLTPCFSLATPVVQKGFDFILFFVIYYVRRWTQFVISGSRMECFINDSWTKKRDVENRVDSP
jgi:hypothetical protein